MQSEVAFDQVRFLLRCQPYDAKSYKEGMLPFPIYDSVRQFMYTCTSTKRAGATRWPETYGWLRAKWPLSSTTELMLFSGYHSKGQAGLISFQINPGELDEEAAAELMLVLDGLLPGGYDFLVEHGRISHVELRNDVIGARFPDYIPIDTRVRRECATFRPIGTTYLGGKRGDRQSKLYDKARELRDDGIVLGHDLLRAEVVLRNLNIPLDELSALAHRFDFESFVIVDRAKLPALKGHYYVDAFFREITKGRLPQQAYQRSANRDELAAALKKKARPDWYDPQAIVAKLPVLVESLRPAALHQMAAQNTTGAAA